jgi:putative DNA primase/helicase
MMAALLDARALAHALGGDALGRNRVLAPGPGHSRADRSLSITLDPRAPDGFLVHSFAGDDPMICRDYVRAAVDLPAWSPGSKRTGAPTPRPVRAPDPGEERKVWLQERVLELWDQSVDLRGTIAELYLTRPRSEGGRGLAFPDDVGHALRFHPACPWREDDGTLLKVPAMIGAMRDIHTDQLRALHRTRLTPDGLKVDRKMLAPAAGAAIKLDPDDAVTMGLTVGEGIETTLAARQIGFRPAWALGSSGGIKTLPVLSGVEALTILEEHDEKGANARAVMDCGTRWHDAGREVITVAPRSGKDVNDALSREAA